ncbi:MAG: CRISPR-associated protein [Bacteroidales bacterium]|nr:CRISPR-associated protein [Bacteroidales bacterium]
MLINLSNHPSDKWSPSQVDAAKRQFGEVVDLPFPDVNPDGDEEYIDQLAEEYVHKVLAMTSGHEKAAVHAMGEMTITYTIVNKLQTHNIQCVASTTRRIVTIREDNTKEVKFDFVKFRSYEFR